MTESKKPKIGLALGSGGSKGLAHIGVIKALEENNIPIDFIAGSSIGAMIGGAYVSGLNIKKIEKIALETNWRRMFSLVDPYLKKGWIRGEKMKIFLDGYLGGKKIEDCKIPFVAVATDLKTGESVVLNKGKIAQAIRASISIPLVFKPVKIDGKRTLADGGLSAPVPVEIVRDMGADIVIAVNLDKHYYDKKYKPGWYNIANDSLNIMRHHLARLNVEKADIVIDINVGKSSWYQFVNGQEKILAGEESTKIILPHLKEIICQKSKSGLKKYLDFFKE